MTLQSLTGTPDPVTSYGLVHVDGFQTNDPFIDMARTMDPFFGYAGGAWSSESHAALDALGIFDENGYPTEIPVGLDGIRTAVANTYPEHDAYRSGVYTLFYEGTGTIEIGGNVKVIAFEPGKIVFEHLSGGNMWFDITETDPDGTGDYVRGISLVHERNLELYEAGAVFNPDYLEIVADARELRFMLWMATNESVQESWDDRATLEDATWAGSTGVPVEIMVQLANEAGVDPWFNIPHLADETYIRNFAEYVRDNLDPRLKAHVEFSNEIWAGAFPQREELRALAIDDWGADLANDYTFFLHWKTKYITEAALIWDDVFGAEADARLVHIMGTQTVNTYLTEQILNPTKWAELEPDTYVDPTTVFDELGVTTYFGLRVLTNSELLDELLAQIDASEADAQAWLYDLLAVDAGYGVSVVEALATLDAQAALASDAGLRLVAYEGGQHVHHSFNVSLTQEQKDILTPFLIEFVRSDYMADLYSQLWEGWEVTGDGPFMNSNAVAKPTVFGSWGLLGDLEDSQPRADYVLGEQTAGGSWWGEGGGAWYQQGRLVEGDDSAETLSGTVEEDYILARGGNDRIEVSPGNDVIHGGDGVDTLILTGKASDYSGSYDAAGRVLLTGPDGSTDKVTSVELVSFSLGGQLFILDDLLAGTIPDDPTPPPPPPNDAVIEIADQGEQVDASDYEAVAVTTTGNLTIQAISPYSTLGKELGLHDAVTPSYVVYKKGFTAEIDGQTVAASFWTTEQAALDDALLLSSVAQNAAAIAGADGNDTMLGRDLGDFLAGMGGNDWIDGRTGDDFLFGGTGDNRLNGGAGTDTALLAGTPGDYTVGMDGSDILVTGVDGSDRLRSVERVYFSDGTEGTVADWLDGTPLASGTPWENADEFAWLATV